MERKLADLSNPEIKEAINLFCTDRKREHRYASYDFCYNYFRGFYDNRNLDELDSESIAISCHYLGYYLASWGMLRGSSKLLTEKSVVVYEDALHLIAGDAGRSIWSIDADKYNSESVENLISFNKKLKETLPTSSDTLTTKIMLGVFGCVPAFDTNFSKSLRSWKVNTESLNKVKKFYDDHKTIIDNYSQKIKTLDISTGRDTEKTYTKAKIIDMIGFQINLKKGN